MEKEILNTAVENLSTSTNILIKASNKRDSFDNFYDGELTFYGNNISFNIPFAIKRKVTLAQLPFLQEYLSKKGILIIEHGSKAIKEHLRKLKINYLEMSGNSYISYNKFYVFIDTNKRTKLEETNTSTAFSKAGLKFIYHLLSDHNAINRPYRELGEMSEVSIDTIGRVYKELIRDRYIVRVDNRNYKIIDYRRLFTDWVTLFNKTLRPKLKKRAFRLTEKKSLKMLLENNIKGKIGGELAAEFLTGYNIAEKANIYLKGSFVDFALEFGMRPDKEGQIMLIEQFWTDSDSSDKIVGFPLVYADLLSNPNPRNLETAKLILDEYTR